MWYDTISTDKQIRILLSKINNINYFIAFYDYYVLFSLLKTLSLINRRININNDSIYQTNIIYYLYFIKQLQINSKY